MYTSKHSGLSPNNQFLRPQRDVSPANHNQSKSSCKYYSAQQVSRMIKSYIQPKLLFLRNELQQKQHIIQQLNQKLDQNDSKLHEIYNYLDKLVRKQNKGQFSQQKGQTLTIINQILNDKLKQYWQTVNTQIQKIKHEYIQKNSFDSGKIQAKVEMQLQKLRKDTHQHIENARLKNNNYWLKIKQALNRINSKVSKVDESLLANSQKLQQFGAKTSEQSQVINELKSSKNVVRKLVELKKSVGNIYENYQNVLQLQNRFKNNIDLGGIHQAEQSNDLIDFDDWQTKQNRHKQIRDANQGKTFPLFRKKNYVENQQSTNVNNHKSNNNNRYTQDSEEIIDLQYSREENGTQGFLGPLTAKTNTKQADRNMFKTKHYVPSSASTSKSNNNNKLIFGAFSPSMNPPQTQKWQNGMNSPNQLSCLNQSTNALRNANSRSTSFVNLSLQNRHQMSQSLKQRLQQIIQLKNLQRPLIVYLDQINYLKNSEGNYLFDTKGNMFKVNRDQGKELQRLGIVRFGQNDQKKQPYNANKANNILPNYNRMATQNNSNERATLIGNLSTKTKSTHIKQTNI